MQKIGQFETDLNELYWNWWTNSVAGNCETLPAQEIKAWFLQEVTLMIDRIMDEEEKAE